MKRSTRTSSVGLSSLRSSVGNFSTRFSSPSFVDRVEKLTTKQRDAIRRAGFGNLLLIPNQTINRKLLVELTDCWSCEKHAFVLPHGEISITLLDIALIVGLNVSGNPILFKEDEPLSDLELEYGATPDKRKISIQALESRLDSLGGTADDDFVRTFLLFTFGYFLFPNSSSNVDTRYLSFLRNVDDICHYAWGEAVLEELLLWLNKRKESNVQYFGGCLTFLQVWSFEHLDIARPNLIDDMAFPRACRWENRKPNPRQSFTGLFQELKGDQIIWTLEPTSYELEIDVVRDKMEIKDVVDEDAYPIANNCSPSTSISASVLGSNCSLQVPDSDTEFETDVTKDTPRFEEIHEPQPREMLTELDLLSEVDCPTMSSHQLELPTQVLELPSSPRETMEIPVTAMVNEDEWRLEYAILQDHVVELEKEITDLRLEKEKMNDLRLENKLLKEQTALIPVLEEDNRKLKDELVNLKREFKNLVSFNPHAVQLEKVVALYNEGVSTE